MLTLMVEDVHFLRIEEDAARLVWPPCIVRPAVPKTGYDSLELARPPVTFVMLDMLGQPEIQRRIGIGGRDDIPSRAAVADVVERREPAGDMVGFVKGRRCRRDQTDPFSHHRKSRKQRQGLEGGNRRAAPQRLIGMFSTARWSAMKNASNRACSSVWMKRTRCFRLKLASG